MSVMDILHIFDHGKDPLVKNPPKLPILPYNNLIHVVSQVYLVDACVYVCGCVCVHVRVCVSL